MAKKTYSDVSLLPLETMIEVVTMKGDTAYKTEMTFGEALKLKKQPGWVYRNYKLGESQFELTNKNSDGKE